VREKNADESLTSVPAPHSVSTAICSPPVGTLLFGEHLSPGTTIKKIVRPLMTILMIVIAVLLVAFRPDLSLWPPRRFGLS
jgi:TRAP-type C4-dicarboxylate transport system permease large subunit